MDKKDHSSEVTTMKRFSGSPDPYFALLLTALFGALSVVLVLKHQLWIDESYYYLVARDAGSIWKVMTVYNFHPHLWSVVLYFFGKVAPGILAMQVFHSAIAASTVFLIALYCPFTRLLRFFIAFGYFFLFEYNVIAKNYALGFFLLFLALVLFQRNKRLVLVALCLGLASNCHPFTLFVCVFLFYYFYRNGVRGRVNDHKWAAGVFVFFILLSVIQMIPSRETFETYLSYGGGGLFSPDRAGRALGAPARGLLNVPDFTGDSFWNSNYIFNHSRRIGYLLSVFLFLHVIWCFRKHRDLCLLFAGPLLLIMAFVYVAPLATGVRYWGYFYLLFLVCVWIYMLRYKVHADLSYILKIVVLLQFVVVIPVIVTVLQRPFSNGKAAAMALVRSGHSNTALFVRSLALGPPLSAYTGNKVYYPSNKTFESYSYDIDTRILTNEEFIRESMDDLWNLHLDSCVLVTNIPAEISAFSGQLDGFSLVPVSSHTGAIVASENYYLYLLRRGR